MHQITGEGDPESFAPDYLLGLYANQYLLALEDVCRLYIEDLLDYQAITSLSTQIRADVEGFLMYFYDEDSGEIGVRASVSVPWLLPDGRESLDDYYRYSNTGRCLGDIGITVFG